MELSHDRVKLVSSLGAVVHLRVRLPANGIVNCCSIRKISRYLHNYGLFKEAVIT
jgi:hypothetical protein